MQVRLSAGARYLDGSKEDSRSDEKKVEVDFGEVCKVKKSVGSDQWLVIRKIFERDFTEHSSSHWRRSIFSFERKYIST